MFSLANLYNFWCGVFSKFVLWAFSRYVARNLTTHNAIHYVSTKIIMALSVTEWHILSHLVEQQQAFDTYVYIMCSQSTA